MSNSKGPSFEMVSQVAGGGNQYDPSSMSSGMIRMASDGTGMSALSTPLPFGINA